MAVGVLATNIGLQRKKLHTPPKVKIAADSGSNKKVIMTEPGETCSVQVIVRLRPMNEKEEKLGTLPVVTASSETKTVTAVKGQGGRQARSSYAFDDVFTSFTTQEEIFDCTLKPVVADVLKGYESTGRSKEKTCFHLLLKVRL